MSTESLFVACTPGLEAALGSELEALGFAGSLVRGGARVEAVAGSYLRLNLWSRVASRVLLRVGEVRSPGELARLPLAPFGERLPEGRPAHLLAVPPEVQQLAAGLLQLARWKPGEALWDVMCGSGTLLVEAAEQAAGLAPGRNRRFAFETFPGHDESAWRALPRQGPACDSSLRGSDLNAGALGTARRNARRAGVLDRLTLERLDATRLPAAAGARGLVVANLPYGRRVGERDALGALYAGLGRSLSAACPGWYFCFLLEAGAERLGLPIAERHRLSNGGLDCEVVLGQVPG